MKEEWLGLIERTLRIDYLCKDCGADWFTVNVDPNEVVLYGCLICNSKNIAPHYNIDYQ